MTKNDNVDLLKMMNRWLLQLIPYLIVTIIVFNGTPMFEWSKDLYISILIIGFPTFSFLTVFLRGWVWGTDLLLSVLVAVSFVPAIFLHYNESAFIYTFIFGVLSLFGSFSGKALRSFTGNRRLN